MGHNSQFNRVTANVLDDKRSLGLNGMELGTGKLHILLLQNMLHHKANATLHFKNSVMLSNRCLADYPLCLE
jgi:hypothetical protein